MHTLVPFPEVLLERAQPMPHRQHTIGHVECPACEGYRAMVIQSLEFGRVDVATAAAIYLQTRHGKIGERTYAEYLHYAEALSGFFGDMPLADIQVENVLAYQAHRQKQIRTTPQHLFAKTKLGFRGEQPSDGASRINHEINCVLRQVLRRAGCWAAIEKYYEPLPVPKDGPGVALTQNEENHLFEVARSRPRWMVAYCCSLLSRCTTAGPGEIRYLKVSNLNLEPPAPAIYVHEGTKNGFRIRTLPLNADALFAVKWLLDRYRGLMRKARIVESKEHYLLPHRAMNRGDAPDPLRPMGSWKKAFYALRAEAAKTYPRLGTLRRYDLRHTACTLMLEDPTISYSTIEKLMGHKVGSRTKQRYDHIRDSTLRVAVDILNGGHSSTRYASKAAPAAEKKPAQRVVENPLSSTIAMYFRNGR
jgi:integrase